MCYPALKLGGGPCRPMLWSQIDSSYSCGAVYLINSTAAAFKCWQVPWNLGWVMLYYQQLFGLNNSYIHSLTVPVTLTVKELRYLTTLFQRRRMKWRDNHEWWKRIWRKRYSISRDNTWIRMEGLRKTTKTSFRIFGNMGRNQNKVPSNTDLQQYTVIVTTHSPKIVDD